MYELTASLKQYLARYRPANGEVITQRSGWHESARKQPRNPGFRPRYRSDHLVDFGK